MTGFRNLPTACCVTAYCTFALHTSRRKSFIPIEVDRSEITEMLRIKSKMPVASVPDTKLPIKYGTHIYVYEKSKDTQKINKK